GRIAARSWWKCLGRDRTEQVYWKEAADLASQIKALEEVVSATRKLSLEKKVSASPRRNMHASPTAQPPPLRSCARNRKDCSPSRESTPGWRRNRSRTGRYVPRDECKPALPQTLL